MIGSREEETIITVVMLLMYISFVGHVFLWFRQKLKGSHVNHVNSGIVNEKKEEGSGEHKEQEYNHQGLSQLSIINLPILRLLQQKVQQRQSTKNKGENQNDSNLIILAAFLLTVMTCLLFLSFCLDEQLLSSIIQPLKQALSQSLNLQQQKALIEGIQISNLHNIVLYHNKQQQLIYRLQLSSVFAFMVIVMRAVGKMDTMSKAGQQDQTQTQTHVSYKALPMDFILRLVMVIANPWFISVIVLEVMLKLCYQCSSNTKSKTIINIYQIIYYLSLIMLLAVQLCYSIYSFAQSPLAQIYSNTIFPRTFTPQSNLMWILYAHMFNRYLPMYQLIMFLLPLSFAIPLSSLKITYLTKVICQYFVIIFTTYQCTDLHVYLFWVLVVFNVNNFLSYKDTLMKTINKTLGLMAFLGSTLFLLLYKKMVVLFLNTWMVNIGYPFLFGCIAWALIVVWIAELIRIQLQQVGRIPYDPKQPGKVMQIIHRFKLWIQNKLWTKNH